MQPRANIHRRFCHLYGSVADHIDSFEVDCICKGNSPDHEETYEIDDAPMDFIEEAVKKHMHPPPYVEAAILVALSWLVLGGFISWLILS